MTDKYKAYLRIRRFDTREIVHSVGVRSLQHRHVERVMLGIMRNMNLEDYFVDDSEVDEAREKAGL